MEERKNLAEARALIPLLRSISSEIRDRRVRQAGLQSLRSDLAESAKVTNEGFTMAVQDLDASIAHEQRGIDAALREIEVLGLAVPQVRPLVVHIPGRTPRGDVIFCWEDGDDGFGESGGKSERHAGNAA